MNKMISVCIESRYVEEYFLIFKYSNDIDEREVRSIIREANSNASSINSFVESLEDRKHLKKARIELVYKNRLEPNSELEIKDYSSDIRICDKEINHMNEINNSLGCFEICIIAIAILAGTMISIAFLISQFTTRF